MLIHINGEKREFNQEQLSLVELVRQLSFTPQRIAIEVNKEMVRRQDWDMTLIKDGDRVEIVHFVGGG